MKTFSFLLYLIFTIAICNAQAPGSIKSMKAAPKSGVENEYIYYPPAKVVMPEDFQIVAAYRSKENFYNKTVTAKKSGNGYTFYFKSADSTGVVIFSVSDASKKPVDNNNGNGYVSYLYDNTGKRFDFSGIDLAILLSGYTQYFLGLSQIENTVLLKKYEDSYQLYPALKKLPSYFSYLNILHAEKKEAAQPLLLDYARQMELAQNDEGKWMNAIGIYELLQLADKKQQLEQKTLSVYPDGALAKNQFWTKYRQAAEQTEQSVLTSMNEYSSRFKDNSQETKDIFYTQIISLLLAKPDWEAISGYEVLLVNKENVAASFNNYAWQLCGDQVDSPSNNLETAKILSAKSLAYIKEMMTRPLKKDEPKQELQGTYNNYSDTYALILYKLGKYDSAFYYQDALYQQGYQLDEGGLERYAAYSEKAKGADYARQVIELQLSKGTNSLLLLKQLKSIYVQLNLPEDGFSKIQQKASLAARQKTASAVKAKYGSTSAKDILLKNLSGETVSLLSFKNKVVVLDFWATWCGPCRASFPAMQQTINQYKNDSGVVFLFIDSWERTTPQKMLEGATKFIADNNYSFNVLLDIDDKAAKDYKVDGIPAKFVIDKKGEIVFMGHAGNIALEIENAKGN